MMEDTTASKDKLKILFATTEAAPYVKVGGLADVAGALPPTLMRNHGQGLDMRLMLPYHPKLVSLDLPVRQLGSFKLESAAIPVSVDLFVSSLEDVPMYLIRTQAIRDSSGVYEADPSLDAEKYVPFSLAILEACRFLGWVPDVLHLNDWHTALTAYALKTIYKNAPLFADVKTMLSVHNLPYNGYGSQPVMLDMGFSPSEDPELPEWARFTPLPLGIASSDKVVFVSKGYADEVLSEPMGSGLAEYLNLHPERLDGYVNGIDTQVWDPANDPKIAHAFSKDKMDGKAANKAAFQEAQGFRVDKRIPLLTVVSRLVSQKGIDIILDALQILTDKPWQFAILGTGDAYLEDRIRAMAADMPERVAGIIKYDDAIAHQLYAAGDMYLMPSLYEPCGLSQMFAMRYGNLPVARATGGLRDTVVDYATDPDNATGFLFEGSSGAEMAETLGQALELFKNQPVWEQLQQNAMARDFSWEQASKAYWNLYRELAA